MSTWGKETTIVDAGGTRTVMSDPDADVRDVLLAAYNDGYVECVDLYHDVEADMAVVVLARSA